MVRLLFCFNATFSVSAGAPPNWIYNVKVAVEYDGGELARWGNAAQVQIRIKNLYTKVQDVYLERLKINITLSSFTKITSTADICGTSHTVLCTHSGSTCTNGVNSIHHKNISKVINNLTLPDKTKIFKTMFSGHRNCYVNKDGVHTVDSIAGIAGSNVGALVIADASYQTDGQVVVTLAHELGHLYGVKDHYDKSYGNTGNIQDNCIWGVNRKTDLDVVNYLTMCPSCTNTILNNRYMYNHS